MNNNTKQAVNGLKTEALTKFLNHYSASELASIIEEITTNYVIFAGSSSDFTSDSVSNDIYHLLKLKNLFLAMALENNESFKFYNEQITKNL